MNTVYFDSLFDDFGIWQHTDGSKPIIKEGYALDDATRGLLLCLSLNKIDQANILFDYIVKSKKDDKIYGFANDKREYIKSPASEDAVGQIVWAFGYANSIGFRPKEASDFISTIIPHVLTMDSLRGPTYALLGALYVDKSLSITIVKKLSDKLKNLDESWFWPETTVTYGNGILPYALLRYALLYSDKRIEKIGRKTLNFLEYICTNNRKRGPIGNDGWYKKGDKAPAVHSQQPIDSAYMVWAWIAAYQISKNPDDLKHAQDWIQWFEGENVANSKMYDPKTNKAFNGIDKAKNKQLINRHSGAETNICFLLSLHMMQTKQTI